MFSLQTIASDLEKYDSIEHLGDLSDVGSVTGDEGERERGAMFDRRDKLLETSAKERQQQFHKQHHRSFSLWSFHKYKSQKCSKKEKLDEVLKVQMRLNPNCAETSADQRFATQGDGVSTLQGKVAAL